MRLFRLLKNDLAKETSDWVDKGIVTQDQAERICAHYDVDYHQENARSLGYNVLIGLGYLFVGLSLIVLIGENWDNIPRLIRMSGLVLLTLTTQWLGWRKYNRGDTGGAHTTFLLGNLFFGASIVLIAQIYHLGEHMADGVFWWALGCLPFALLTKSPILSIQTLLLAAIWFFIEVGAGFYPRAFPIFLLAAIYVLYSGKTSIVLLLSTVACSAFFAEYAFAELWREGRHFDFYIEHVFVSIALFILLYAFGHYLSIQDSAKAKDYGSVLAVWGLRFGLLCMIVFSFEDPWRGMIDADWQHIPSMLFAVGMCVSLALYFSWRAGRVLSMGAVLALLVLTVIALLSTDKEQHAVYFQVLYNIALVMASVWLISRGIRDAISHYFFIGLAAILITAFMRYVDLIGNYIGGAVLFMVFAVILLSAAKYWKSTHSQGGTHES